MDLADLVLGGDTVSCRISHRVSIEPNCAWMRRMLYH